jgi:type VI secretion system secreted protein VgrG
MKGLLFCFLVLPLLATNALAGSINLGTAASFGVLGASTVTNTGPSVINGDLGLYPGTSITGFPPGIVNGTIHLTDAVAMQAQADALTAYNVLAGLSSTANLTGMNLGGLTLTPGVYTFNSSALLTGALTINFQGLSNQNIVFQMGSTLTTGSASSIVVINPGHNDNIFWQVGSSATLGSATAFQGTIIAYTSITLVTGTTINCGRAIALNGAVTMDTNTVDIDNCAGGTPIPEPATMAVLVPGLLGAGAVAVEPSTFAVLGLCGAISAFRRKRRL